MPDTSSQIRQEFYPTVLKEDEKWGLVLSSVGMQLIEPNEVYPPVGHPENYYFSYESGRVLDEFQLIYLVENKGYFTSDSVKHQEVSEGTLIMLFPGEWHTYCPSKRTGWRVYWVGFKGNYADQLVRESFFSPVKPLYKIGYNDEVLNLFQQLIHHTGMEKPGYHMLLGGIVAHLLGYLYHYQKASTFTNKSVIPRINKAKMMMREQIHGNLTPPEIAESLNISYVWFRQCFKQYTGFSPAQYQNHLKIQYAKDMLARTNLTVKEIANKLNFESPDYFSVFFKRHTKETPLQYRFKFK